jgi:AcrR family transcriptional regulator
MERRVARTKGAIEDAFVQLVLEHGYSRVNIEEIADRADVARATFYAHYPNKEAVLFSVFNRLIDDLMQRIAYRTGPWDEVRRDAVRTVYRCAAERPEVYRACLSDARLRESYIATLSRYVEQNFRNRLKALAKQPRVPVPVMARGFVGALLAILEGWLAGDLKGEPERLADMALDLVVAGTAWAQGLRLDEIGYPADPAAKQAKPTAQARKRRSF